MRSPPETLLPAQGLPRISQSRWKSAQVTSLVTALLTDSAAGAGEWAVEQVRCARDFWHCWTFPSLVGPARLRAGELGHVGNAPRSGASGRLQSCGRCVA